VGNASEQGVRNAILADRRTQIDRSAECPECKAIFRLPLIDFELWNLGEGLHYPVTVCCHGYQILQNFAFLLFGQKQEWGKKAGVEQNA
jgi:hypothetical protein